MKVWGGGGLFDKISVTYKKFPGLLHHLEHMTKLGNSKIAQISRGISIFYPKSEKIEKFDKNSLHSQSK